MEVRSYKFRLYPNQAQDAALVEMLSDFCSLYNAGLQQRIEAYRRRRKTLTFFDQVSELKATRAAEPNLARWSFTALGNVLRKVDHAYASFFRRGHGFPRFRSPSRFHTVSFRVHDGLTLKKDGRIGIVGLPGTIKVRRHRSAPPEAKFLSALISRQNGKWYIIFAVKAEFAEACGTASVGIDLGLNSLIATSDGEVVKGPRLAQKAQKAQRRRQRAVARCKRGSRRRIKAKARLAASFAKIANQRRDFAHKLSRRLVSCYGAIAFEDLNMAGLKRSVLARPIHDAAWSQLVQFTTYKAESAGGRVVLVDPRRTSQTCPSCGTIKTKTLKTRTHACECGAVLDRDVAAAMIVHQRAFGLEHSPQALTGQVAA